MIEDSDYRSSSQYRLWSFTPDQLQTQRAETNHVASEKVRAAFARSEPGPPTPAKDTQADINTDTEIQTLTPEEEQRVVQWGCEKIASFKSELQPPPPSFLLATAMQFLRRFYLYNSPMTYHPKTILVSAFWIATKAEHYIYTLSSYVEQVGVTEDDVKAPEFLIMQALRFTLEVRHPMRGLEGGVAEIQLRASALKCLEGTPALEARNRIEVAAEKAKRLLSHDAQMTDAYFLYTPSQIWLAALHVADSELTKSYISHLFGRLGTSTAPIKQKLIDTVTQCADIIKSYRSQQTDKAAKSEMGRIGRKLKKCQDPEKTDIVAVARDKAAEKRGGTEEDMEKANKKRKAERERLERDGNVFGPDLKSMKKA